MKHKKVLIVDDNALNRKVFENIIGYSYLFEVATNGLEAIDKIKSDRFDIILMDIQMPKLDGISALKIIKEESLTDSPIIAISAYSNQADREYFLSTGFDDFMAKPVRPKDLLESIYYHINKNSPGEEIYSATDLDLDGSIVEKLMKYNSVEDIKTVYMDFLEEAEGLLGQIKHLIEHKSFSEINEKLHILKGNSGTLGGQKIFRTCTVLESKIKSSDFDGVEEDVFMLERLLVNFKNNLKVQNIY